MQVERSTEMLEWLDHLLQCGPKTEIYITRRHTVLYRYAIPVSGLSFMGVGPNICAAIEDAQISQMVKGLAYEN